jgi:hypothetical protein
VKDKFQELSKDELMKIVYNSSSRPLDATSSIVALVFVVAVLFTGAPGDHYNSALICVLAAVSFLVMLFILPSLIWQMKRLSALIELLRKSNVLQ